jgi:hypothetical protein
MLAILVWFGNVVHISQIGLVLQLDTDYSVYDILHVAHGTKINVTDGGLVWQCGAYSRRLCLRFSPRGTWYKNRSYRRRFGLAVWRKLLYLPGVGGRLPLSGQRNLINSG